MNEIEQLAGRLCGGGDERAEAAVKLLTGHGVAAVPALRGLLEASAGEGEAAADCRWWALRALAEIPDPQAVALLRASLTDPDASVRQCAALGLRTRFLRDGADPGCIPVLTAGLSDPDPLYAALAADALIALAAEAVPALIEVLQGGSQPARRQAVRALAAIGDPRAIPALFQALDDPSALVEYWANDGLDRMGVGMSFFNP